MRSQTQTANSERILRITLRGATGAEEARALAAQFLVEMPYSVRAIPVARFLRSIPRMSDERVADFLRAASINPGRPLGELSVPQRAALAGALRLRQGRRL